MRSNPPPDPNPNPPYPSTPQFVVALEPISNRPHFELVEEFAPIAIALIHRVAASLAIIIEVIRLS